MKSPDCQLKVFVSSTSEDLKDYRAIARNTILRRGWVPEMMESWNATPLPTVTACFEKLARCDLLLLLVAFRCGWVPTNEQGGNGLDSITALELDFARKHQIPVLAMLASDTTWPGNLWEHEQRPREWVTTFRSDLNQIATFFDWEPPNTVESQRLQSFRAKVSEVLVDHEKRLMEQPASQPHVMQDAGSFECAREGLLEGLSIPFLGQHIYGDEGPLSTRNLVHALLEKESEERECLTTAAEFRERALGHRALFLNRLRKCLEKQSQDAKCPLVLDILTRIKPPQLIVSTTCDLLLERQLEAAGKSYTLLTHILHSSQGRHDGKILIFRYEHGMREYELCPADKAEFGKTEYVIYKPLGSPLLHDGLDRRLELDTVVMTEGDLVKFLGRLQHQETGVPTSLGRLFQSQPLLFIGYPLDVWHYRLVLQVFRTTESQARDSSRLAIRQPASDMETLAWRRLGTDLLFMNPATFAERLQADLPVA